MARKPGPKPKPTTQKKRAGNPGKRALNKNEPLPRQSLPLCPDWCHDGILVVWAELAPALFEAGLLTDADREAFAQLCEDIHVYRDAVEQLEKEGLTTTSAQGGIVKHPLVNIVREYGNSTRLKMAEFGMTPSSRSSIQLPKKPDDVPDPKKSALQPLQVIDGGQK